MEVEIFSKSSNLGRQRNLVLDSRINFHASERLLPAISGHNESSDHNRDSWIVDSRANAHVYNDLKWLLSPIDLSNEDLHLRLVDDKKVKIEAFGDVYLKFDQGSFFIWKVACTTKLNMSFIYVSKLQDEGCKILFDDHVTIMRDNVTLCIGRKHQGLFELFPEPFGPRVDTTTILELE